MARKVFKRILVDSQTNARGNIVLNANGMGAAPEVSVKRLLFLFSIDCSANTVTLDLEQFAQSVNITSRYRDGSPMCESVNASLLDFRSAAFRSGDTRTGLGDFAGPGVMPAGATTIRLRLAIEFTDPRRREANDVSVPLAEIGQFNIAIDPTAGVGGAGTLTGFTVTMHAHCTEEKEPVLGLRPVYSLQSLTGNVTQWDNGGRILRAIDALATTNATNLQTQIANGWQFFADNELAVDCSTIPTIEEFNAEFQEPHYKPFTALYASTEELAGNNPPVSGSGFAGVLSAACEHGRIYDINENVSATDLQPVGKCKLQVNNPGANINAVQLLITAYEPQTAETLQRRKAALGLGTASVEANVTDTQAGAQLTPAQKLAIPAVIGTR